MKRRTLDEAVAALAAAQEAGDVLEAAGQLVLLGAAHAVGPRQIEIDLGIDEIEEDAFALLASLEAMSIDELRSALERRDAIELKLIGAEAILGGAPPLSVEEESALIAFEEALRPHLWRLTAFNEWRALEVAWMAPAHRSRFWWWSEASELDPRGAIHLDAVAELVARFPQAEARLHQLAATELLLRAKVQSAQPIDLRAWIRAHDRPLAMAASTGPREQVLYQHRSFTLSLLPPSTLLIDLLERCGPERPRLRVGASVIEAEPVPDALERYRFELESLSDAVRAELVVSLATGMVRVSLPPST